MMCTLTQRELDFLASLKTGWRLLYRRELMRLLKDDAELREARPKARPIIWRGVSGQLSPGICPDSEHWLW